MAVYIRVFLIFLVFNSSILYGSTTAPVTTVNPVPNQGVTNLWCFDGATTNCANTLAGAKAVSAFSTSVLCGNTSYVTTNSSSGYYMYNLPISHPSNTNCPWTTRNVYYYYNRATCPSGSSFNTSQSTCVYSTPQCPSGYTYSSFDNLCHSPPEQDCPSGQYRNQSNTCISIPDCNSGQAEGGFYFSVSAAQCMSAVFDGSVVACTNSARPRYCPATDDCYPVGKICTDNTNDYTDWLNERTQVTPPAKSAAESSAQDANNSKNDAAAAAAAKLAAAQAAQQNAQASANQAQANPNQAALDAAAVAAQQASQAAQKAANAAAQAQLSNDQAVEAARQRDLITNNDFPPGRASNAADRAASAAQQAAAKAVGAINGDAVGDEGNTDPLCPDCAKESTLKELMAGDATGPAESGTPGTFDNAIPDDALTETQTAYTSKVNEIKQSITSLISLDSVGVSELPVFEGGNYYGQEITVDFNRWATPLSYFAYAILFAAAVLSVRIILD